MKMAGRWHASQRFRRGLGLAILLFASSLSGCIRPGPESASPSSAAAIVDGLQEEETGDLPAVNPAADPASVETQPTTHTVVLGETLSTIAAQYGTDVNSLMTANRMEDGNRLLPGQVLLIPESQTQAGATEIDAYQTMDFQIISDHELVYGLDAADFEMEAFVAQRGRALPAYEEEVEGQLMDGVQIVQLVADRHSLNPKLLLALLEYEAGWLSHDQPPAGAYMLGHEQEGVEGLYKQLSWAANMLNWGFYGRADGGMSAFALGDSAIDFAPSISNGTAGVQLYLAARDGISYQTWLRDAGPEGLAATYRSLFGPSAVAATAPLLPQDLQQPRLLLPWEKGDTWYFSGGPHGGWNSGSAWAALDFVPPDVEYSCGPSESWVTAVADGVIARSGHGAVVLDLDGDGYAGSGWAITYMHLDSRQRIGAGVRVTAGERLGHPGCEGGFTNGTHLHLARTYNGRWISADGDLPFDLDGWISSGVGYEYNGWLARGGETKTADVYKTEDNAITNE